MGAPSSIGSWAPTPQARMRGQQNRDAGMRCDRQWSAAPALGHPRKRPGVGATVGGTPSPAWGCWVCPHPLQLCVLVNKPTPGLHPNVCRRLGAVWGGVMGDGDAPPVLQWGSGASGTAPPHSHLPRDKQQCHSGDNDQDLLHTALPRGTPRGQGTPQPPPRDTPVTSEAAPSRIPWSRSGAGPAPGTRSSSHPVGSGGRTDSPTPGQSGSAKWTRSACGPSPGPSCPARAGDTPPTPRRRRQHTSWYPRTSRKRALPSLRSDNCTHRES